jgi:predicted acetylornithine/succinylornithine family transaminase
MTEDQSVRELEARHVLQVYRRAPITIVRGKGVHVWDDEGRKYLDLVSGVGVAVLGHANARLAAAIADQAQALLHCSNLYFHPLQGLVAERLAKLSGLDRAFFCNSGTEAVEGCLKLARRYWFTKGERARTGIVALEHAFHGRTLGSLSATWDEHYRAPFEPLLPGITFVPADDPEALARAVTSTTGAILVEPIQGEGGVRPLTSGFAAAVNEASRRTGALVIADEVQSGLGRTGHAFYSAAIGLRPSLVAVGKALGAGVPVAAALASEEVGAAVSFGDHGSTYGGNLLACRAALVFLDELEGGLLDHVGSLGPYVRARLEELAGRHPVIADIRGCGLMWGIELKVPAAPLVGVAREHGLLINATAERVIRLLPPFVITPQEVDLGIAALDATLARAGAEVPA